MPVTTIAVTGTLTDPSGGPRAGVPVTAELVSGTSPVIGYDSGDAIVGTVSTTTGADGTWTLSLIDNADITPANTSYRVTLGDSSPAFIQVPSTGGPYNMASILVTPPPAGSALGIRVSSNGVLVGTRPELNLVGATSVIDNASANRVDATVSGGGSGGINPLGVVFNVETYGAVADGTTDNYTAFNNAWNAMLASPFGGTLFLPTMGVYRVLVDARVQHFTNGQYCVFPIPARASDLSHPALFLRMQGVGEAVATRQYPGAGQSTALNTSSSVILIDYTTSFAWSSSFGHPSFIGAPDKDKANSVNNVHFSIKHVTFRQPNNPSLCGVNLETLKTSDVYDMFADVNIPLDTSAEPTHPTGVPIMLPATGNAVDCRMHRYGAWGYYAGIPITEHNDADGVKAYACKIGMFIRRTAFAHPAQIKHVTTEEDAWGLAGYDPTALTSNGGVVACPNWVIQILFWDTEHFDRNGTAPWMYPPAIGATKADVYDPNNVLKGFCYWMRVNSGANPDGDFETIWVTGGANFSIFQLAAPTTAATRRAGGNPAAANPPNAPTIGTATAGNASATVAFTPAATGDPATSFTATSTPGSITGTGAASPITVSGLTNGTAYTFTVHGTNTAGNSAESASSNSVTPTGGGPTTFAADTFDRADSNTSLGTSSGGQAWTSLDGVWGISSNQAYHVSDGGTDPYDIVVLDAAHGLVTYTIDFTPRNGPMDNGLCVLVQDRSNLIFWDISGDGTAGANNMTTRLFHRSGGSFTGITSATNITMAGGTTYNLKMVVAATSISCFVNNSLIFASSGATGLEAQTKHGLMMADSQGDTFSRWNNLLITS